MHFGTLRDSKCRLLVFAAFVSAGGCRGRPEASVAKDSATAIQSTPSHSASAEETHLAMGEWAERGSVAVYSGLTMGSTFAVSVANLPEAQRDQVAANVDDSLRLVDKQMSTWRDDSEIAALNRAKTGEAVAISAEFAEVLSLAQRVSVESEGAYDVSVTPVVEAWGFGASREKQQIPEESALQAARARVGYKHIKLSTGEQNRVVKGIDGMRLDLASIAPGYAADLIVKKLKSIGLPNLLVDVGGEVRGSGEKPGGEPWRVAVEVPAAHRDDAPKILHVVALREQALATSGDYRQYFEIDGVRYSHALDPRTGRPAANEVASASVLHAQAAQADAYATALMVLGPEAGWTFAQANDLAVCLILRNGQEFAVRMSAGFEKALLPSTTKGGQ
jgi:thiamine biosynthesis lipoprotein